jgi:threonine/homoserine/homoserine lactone efflux protein
LRFDLYIYIALQSFLIGISIAAPVGPIGILCIRRTLAEGRIAGFVSGLGAASADAVYGAIAAFGLTFISVLLVQQTFWLKLVGGLFLIFLGIRTFFTPPTIHKLDLRSQDKQSSMIRFYASTFFLTITNPLTILSFAAIFASLGGSETDKSGDYLASAIMVLGIFLGSCAWWFILSGFTGYFRRRLNEKAMIWINRTSGVIITGFGLLALASLLF